MSVKLSPDIDSPAAIAVTGTVDLRAAVDIVDLADLLVPEAVIVHLAGGTHLTAEALTHLAKHLRRRDVRLAPAREAHHMRFVLNLVGIPTIDLIGVPAGIVAA